MSYAGRNTLIIAVFWALLLGVGFFYTNHHQSKVIAKLITQKKQLSQRVEELKKTKAQLAQLKVYYSHLIELNSGKNGVIPSQESPGETFDYLLREVKRSKNPLEINLTFEKQDSVSSVLKRTYKVDGTGHFVDIYKLLWFLENGPVFYSVKSIDIFEANNNDEGTYSSPEKTKYAFEVESFNREDGPKITEINWETGSPKPMARLMKILPGRHSAPSPNTYPKRNLMARKRPDTRTASAYKSRSSSSTGVSLGQILAVTPTSIVIKTRAGKVIKLRVGDKISGGYLREINSANNQAIFEMNDGLNKSELVLGVSSK
ncbi:MAG: hypothetical protein GWP06_16420 [Actinobacteria bacterium]|nr:hypothetical protein [Actinomycetota bacterium]